MGWLKGDGEGPPQRAEAVDPIPPPEVWVGTDKWGALRLFDFEHIVLAWLTDGGTNSEGRRAWRARLELGEEMRAVLAPAGAEDDA